jgi:hypothetical protein
MSDTPTQRELRSEFDLILAAHEGRARLTTQLHRQAIATANDLSARQKAIKASIAKDARRRKTEAWLIAAGAIFVSLAASSPFWCSHENLRGFNESRSADRFHVDHRLCRHALRLGARAYRIPADSPKQG